MLTIYKASAGSGKTYNLAKDYITALLGTDTSGDAGTGVTRLNHPSFGPVERNRHRSILAITFTNKATEEMKSRIINDLYELAHPDPDPGKRVKFTDDLIDHFGCTGDQLAESAGIALTALLNDYGMFNVSTIDSFFQQVLRNLAYELDYPGDFEVTLDGNNVVAEGIAMMLDDFNISTDTGRMRSPLAATLRSYMKERRKRGKSFDIFNRNNKVHVSVINNIAELFNEQYQLNADSFEKWLDTPDALADLVRYVTERRKAITEENIALGAGIVSEFESAGYPGLECLDGRTYRKVPALANSGKTFTPAQLRTAAYIAGFDPKMAPGDVFTSKFRDTVPADLGLRFISFMERFKANSIEAITLDIIGAQLDNYSLMKFAIGYIRKYRRDNNLIVLADTNQLLYRIIGGENQVPFVYEKMGVRLKHFLIDEFQDTSVMQWRNLRPLVDNGLATGADSLIIGDVKQAIYRFRNSDSSLLDHVVPSEYPGANMRGTLKADNTNWRTSHDVIRFNNTLFSRWSASLGLTAYDNVAQHTAPKHLGQPGYVRLHLADPDPPSAEDDGDLTPLMRSLVREIERERLAGYADRDIAVLVRTRGQGVLVASALMYNGISVMTDEALLLAKSHAVNTIVSMMNLMQYSGVINTIPQDSDHRVRPDIPSMISSFEFWHDRLAREGGDTHEVRQEALRRAFDFDNPDMTLANAVAEIAAENPSTLTSLVEVIVDKKIPPAMRVREMLYIAAFQDAVLEYTQTYGNNLAEFLRYWNQKSDKLSVTSSESANAVKVMTIHKSKGLEFGCVHIPFAGDDLVSIKAKNEDVWVTVPPSGLFDVPNRPPALRVTVSSAMNFPGSPFFDLYRQTSDEILADGFNRVYVAMTRAKRELHLYFFRQSDGNPPKGGVYRDVMTALRAEMDPTADSSLFVDTKPHIDANGEFTLGTPTTPEEDGDNGRDSMMDKELRDIPIPGYNVITGGRGKTITSVEAIVGSPEEAGDTDDEEAVPMTDNPEGRIRYVLGLIRRRSDMETAIRRASAHAGLNEGEAAAIRAMFADDRIAEYMSEWFDKQHHAVNGMALYTPTVPADRQIPRLSRMVHTSGGTMDLILYTGADPSGVRSDNEILHAYRDMFATLYPGASIRMFIVDPVRRTVQVVD